MSKQAECALTSVAQLYVVHSNAPPERAGASYTEIYSFKCLGKSFAAFTYSTIAALDETLTDKKIK